MADTDPKPIGFTPEQAQKLLKADLANLAMKVANRKPLTAAERSLLQSVAIGDEVTLSTGWANNQVELAQVLKKNRRTIQRWLKLPGNPGSTPDGRFNVSAWREWCVNNGHRLLEIDEATPDKQQIEAQILLKKSHLLDIEIKRRLGEVTDNENLTVWIAELVGAAKTVLLSVPGILAPQVVGLSVPDAEQRIREAIDEALMQLHREPWKEEQPASGEGAG